MQNDHSVSGHHALEEEEVARISRMRRDSSVCFTTIFRKSLHSVVMPSEVAITFIFSGLIKGMRTGGSMKESPREGPH